MEKNNYTALKVLCCIFPLLGYLGAVIHAKDEELYKFFIKWSNIGIIIFVALVAVIFILNLMMNASYTVSRAAVHYYF